MRAPRTLINGEASIRQDVLTRLGITGPRIDDPALMARAMRESVEADGEDNRRAAE